MQGWQVRCQPRLLRVGDRVPRNSASAGVGGSFALNCLSHLRSCLGRPAAEVTNGTAPSPISASQ
eukprot:1754802-Amphidinium_carterae.1